MPIYQYQVINDDGSGGLIFEIEQRMTDPALTEHPITQKPVKRVYSAPNLATRYTPGSTKNKLENSNVEKHGFTKYERDKLTGTYHKVAGSDRNAPETFKKPPAGI
ncbi:MAG: FmdB family zinc ribbon protein [Opitutales bacterium]